MNTKEKMEFLKDRGWHQWYNDNYWVNKKTVADPKQQDYTYYGMSLDEAVEYEHKNEQPQAPGLDPFSQFNKVFKTGN